MVLVASAAANKLALFSFSFLYYVCLLSSDQAAALDLDHHGGHRGFSVELIHRDSPKSPLYNPSETPSQRLANAIRRSISRASTRFSSRISSSSSSAAAAAAGSGSAQSTVFTNHGEYVMTLSLGTPPFPIVAIADTGSDLIWTQCKPCSSRCYKQTAPLFDPKSSKTYNNTPCASTLCQSISGAKTSCSSGDTSCHYFVSYGDQSYSRGDIATDTVTLSSTTGSAVSFPNIVIGCGHDNAGTFNEEGSGIVGLGGGSDSLVSQMGSSIGGKFSYCLVPAFDSENKSKNSSKLNFGSNAVVSGGGVVSTPLVLGGQDDTFYYLTLEGTSVAGVNSKNNKYIKFKTHSGSAISSDESEGNIVIDSGTTLTLLPSEFYSDLESAVTQEIAKSNATQVEDPSGLLSLCYDISQSGDLQFPIITMHFKGGADVKLSGINTFVAVSDQVVCFAMVSSTQGLSIYGNLAQMNFLVGYDRQKNTVSFKPTDCTDYI